MTLKQFVPEVLTSQFESWTKTVLLSMSQSQVKAYRRHEHINYYGRSEKLVDGFSARSSDLGKLCALINKMCCLLRKAERIIIFVMFSHEGR